MGTVINQKEGLNIGYSEVNFVKVFSYIFRTDVLYVIFIILKAKLLDNS